MLVSVRSVFFIHLIKWVQKTYENVRFLRLSKPIIQEALKSREGKLILDYNKKDSLMMNKLASAIKKINALNVTGPQDKGMEFFLEKELS